jgi:hypothetical protein
MLMMTISRSLIPPALIVALFAGVLTPGCGGDRFGSELKAQPAAFETSSVEGETIRLPQDRPFSITLTKGSEEPGLGGSAGAGAEADEQGRAGAQASVDSGGMAHALFQLGHAFTNATDRQADFEFTISFEHAYEVSATPEVRLPDASVGLNLYARAAGGRLLRDMTLIDYSTLSGAARQTAKKTVAFSLVVGPNETVNVFLAGQSQVEVPAERSAEADLQVTGLTYEVVTKPAPAVRKTGDASR